LSTAVTLATKSDIAVLVLGDSEKTCGEWGDRSGDNASTHVAEVTYQRFSPTNV
jgi:hypothetical protein